ncbi:hypothetical protein NTHI1209_01680 [Haemophilus influenzae]|uniref:Uncharacterized protein n=1 Tax=Haemophilus influenzae TaxID=727 RepID=A0A158SYU6_HAEIF|nr:hypothetical protein NTHI1209_01680 [Haemophilus influenzae]
MFIISLNIQMVLAEDQYIKNCNKNNRTFIKYR